jgi:hypothetical protein
MNDVKDTAAIGTTLAGGGFAMMGLNEVLTFALLLTGIILNIIRIRAVRKGAKDKKKD